MTIIKHTLPEYKEISILPLADLHMGDINCDFKRVMEWIDYVKNTPDAFCILNGDLMDVAIMGSIASKSVYGELQNYKPNSLDTPVIHLDGTRRRATATL